MRLRIDRVGSNPKNTFGLWFVDSDFFGFSIEDAYHEIKIPGQTRIPAGIYKVALTWSPKFERNMWEILNVPGFTGVRIHPVKTADWTEGCIGPGWQAKLDLMGMSRIEGTDEAFKELDRQLQQAWDAGEEIKILISDAIIERADLDW